MTKSARRMVTATAIGAMLALAGPLVPSSAAAMVDGNDDASPLRVADVTIDTDALSEVYADRDHAPFWVDSDGPTMQAEAAVAMLRQAHHHGLLPSAYNAQALADLLDEGVAGANDDAMHFDSGEHGVSESALLGFEVLLSQSVVAFAEDVKTGRVEPTSIDSEFDYSRRSIDPAQVLDRIASSDDPEARLHDLAPPHERYADLMGLLARYRDKMEEGGWPTVDRTDGVVRQGERDDRIPIIRDRLRATGDYHGDPATVSDGSGGQGPEQTGDARLVRASLDGDDGTASRPADADVYDAELVAAVERFQERHGLTTDGVLGPKTFGALSVDVETRVEQIVAGMERWRWVPRDLSQGYGRHITVNTAGFQMDVVDQGELVERMDVIVGRPSRQTPLFSSKLTWLEFNPTWTIPNSIAVNDKLPRLRENPFYLWQEGIRLYDGWHSDAEELGPEDVDWNDPATDIRNYRLVQQPGPGNALGRVKFMMANSFSIYLHDTPARHLFDTNRRAHSSGCIRVKDPEWLTDFLLEDQAGWSQARKNSLLGDQEWQTQRMTLEHHVPVHLMYETAWTDDSGTIQFRDDLYEIDRKVAESLVPDREGDARFAQKLP